MEMIKYNGKMIPYEQYMKTQKKLWEQMIKPKDKKPTEVLTQKQKYGTDKISVEAARYLYLQIVKLAYEKLAQ